MLRTRLNSERARRRDRTAAQQLTAFGALNQRAAELRQHRERDRHQQEQARPRLDAGDASLHKTKQAFAIAEAFFARDGGGRTPPPEPKPTMAGSTASATLHICLSHHARATAPERDGAGQSPSTRLAPSRAVFDCPATAKNRVCATNHRSAPCSSTSCESQRKRPFHPTNRANPGRRTSGRASGESGGGRTL